MKTLFTYLPALGCSAMMVVCLVMMCGSRLWRRNPTARTDVAPTPAEAPGRDTTSVVPGEVLAELAALRSEVAQLRASAPSSPAAVEAPAARG